MGILSLDENNLLGTVRVILGTIFVYSIVKVVQMILNYRSWAPLYDKLPGEPSQHWFWGNLYQYPGPNEAGLKFQMERCDKYPLFHRLWISFRPILIFHHPETVKVILRSTEPKPRSLGTVYIMGIPWLGEGLLIANHQKWARNRRLLTPAFHFDILQPYIKVKNKAADVLLEKLGDLSTKKTSFDLFHVIGLASLDIILQCAFSYQSECQKLGSNHPYVQAVIELSDLWVERSLQPLLYFDFVYFLTPKGRRFKKQCDFVHSVAEEIIEKRRITLAEEGNKERTERKSRYLDFLDILLTARDEYGTGLTSLEIRNEVDTFLFEGHDTTTSSMCWLLYSLAAHPEHQGRCQEEVDEILKGRDVDDIEWADLQKLEYLTMCIKESMRLHTPVSFIQRVTTQDTEIEGHHVPSGTVIGIQIYNLHHNKEVWDRPYEFDPTRFTPENSANRDSFAFVPFSAGPRYHSIS
ncbi:hypothetical protein FSP39_013651 [Pinctada imbricata]|uniref:Uncharacterized protein n=1 Tax=Pinctada imbricata TaxID=66713 RepID=A0AA88YSY5_PINIB|nr:hypothetical protein FSP39_013651 [Pinctada imbricata]